MQRAVLRKKDDKGTEATSPATDGSAKTRPSPNPDIDLKKVKANVIAMVVEFKAAKEREKPRAAAKEALGITT